MKRPLLLVATGVSGFFALCAALQPINSTITRVLSLASLVAFGACLFLLSKGHRSFRIALFVMAATPIFFLSLPGRPVNKESLKARYVAALTKCVGSPYVWGGEKSLGIDCSGLPRKALRDALFEEGISTLNGDLLRSAWKQWWFDASAEALANGYRNYVVPVPDRGKIKDLHFGHAQPGDLAITDSGIHCLVYLRDRFWIQADPGVGKVEIFDVTKSDNGWFDAPVKLYRWSDFQKSPDPTIN